MTKERSQAFEKFRAIVGPRLRVTADGEGLPVILGRSGQIERYCDGVDCHSCPMPGEFALAVYTDRPRLFQKLWAIPGVRHHQTGDQEMRAVFPPEALSQGRRGGRGQGSTGYVPLSGPKPWRGDGVQVHFPGRRGVGVGSPAS